MNNEEKILKMLEQMQTRIDRIDTRSQRTAVLLETEVDRKLNFLYEGHEAIDGIFRQAPVQGTGGRA